MGLSAQTKAAPARITAAGICFHHPFPLPTLPRKRERAFEGSL